MDQTRRGVCAARVPLRTRPCSHTKWTSPRGPVTGDYKRAGAASQHAGSAAAQVAAAVIAIKGIPAAVDALAADAGTAAVTESSTTPVAVPETAPPAVAAETGGGAVEDLAGACHSFAPATLVVLADGSTKPISQVAIGDRVRTTDPATGEEVVRTVTALHRNHDSDLADVIVRGRDGRESTVHTTQHHRFWDDSRGGWVDAFDLTTGDRLHMNDRSEVSVELVRSFDRPQWMYDLTVDDVHTYYVIAGDSSVLVHNCGRLAPDPDAVGPHTTFSRDPVTGEITHYATWEPNPYPDYPSDWIQSSHYDGVGRAHFNKVTGDYVPTPHVQGRGIPGGVRPAVPWEIPGSGASAP